MSLIEEIKNGRRNLYGANLRGADLTEANLSEANLSEANLYWANLRGANLHGADLRGANLHGADLYGANLRGADLRGANLHGADLYGANLRGADLRGADLSEANLRGADLRGANLPSPTLVLLAKWGEVSNELTQDLMNLDASCHPEPDAFKIWALEDGACPYFGVKVQRAALFLENPELWDPTRPLCRPFDLMARLLREKCKDSDYHDKESAK